MGLSGPSARLVDALAAPHAALVAHPLYATLRERAALRRFMAAHAFAAWDFMSLLKTLQQRLTCVRTPWTPPPRRKAARLVNEIVLGEETDEIEPGVFCSHFELYLEAMREVGADTAPIEGFVRAVAEGEPWDTALAETERACGAAVAGVGPFVRATFAVAAQDTVAVAAAFLLGRERLVPAMFESMLAGLGDASHARFRLYL